MTFGPIIWISGPSYEFRVHHMNFGPIIWILGPSYDFRAHHMTFGPVIWISGPSYEFRVYHMNFGPIIWISGQSYEFRAISSVSYFCLKFLECDWRVAKLSTTKKICLLDLVDQKSGKLKALGKKRLASLTSIVRIHQFLPALTLYYFWVMDSRSTVCYLITTVLTLELCGKVQ